MPIRFEQPSPMAPDIVAAGAAAHQLSQDMPTLARLYEAQMSNATHASIAGAQVAQRNMEARAQAANQGYAIEVQRQHGQEALAASQRVSERDQFLAASQAQQLDQRTMNAMWLNQQEVSQAEMMRLQRLQNAVGSVMADETLLPDEKNDLITQLRTGIDPVKHRVEKQRAMFEEQQQQKIMSGIAKQEATEAENVKFRAMTAQDRVKAVKSEDGSLLGHMIQEEPGKFKFHEVKPEKTTAEKEFNEPFKKSEDYAKALVMEANPEFEMADSKGLPDPVKKAAFESLVAKTASKVYLERERAFYAAQGNKKPAAGSPPAVTPPPAPDQGGPVDVRPPAGPGGAPPVVAAPAAPPPTPLQPEEKKTPVFQQTMKTFDAMKSKVDDIPDLSDGQKAALLGIIDRRQELFDQWGPRMPPEVRQEYEQLGARLRAVPSPVRTSLGPLIPGSKTGLRRIQRE